MLLKTTKKKEEEERTKRGEESEEKVFFLPVVSGDGWPEPLIGGRGVDGLDSDRPSSCKTDWPTAESESKEKGPAGPTSPFRKSRVLVFWCFLSLSLCVHTVRLLRGVCPTIYGWMWRVHDSSASLPSCCQHVLLFKHFPYKSMCQIYRNDYMSLTFFLVSYTFYFFKNIYIYIFYISHQNE